MEFDNNGKLIPQMINQKIEHETEYDDNAPPIRKVSSIYAPLVEFIYNYAKNHIYISKRMASGLYIIRFNPKHNQINTKEYQRKISRQLCLIFNVFSRMGFCEKYGQNTVKIDRDKLKKYSLDDILEYVIKG